MKILLVIFLSLTTISISFTNESDSLFSINGKVIDGESNKPLAGVNVFFNNIHIGASTDVHGNFTLQNVSAGNNELIVSYVGYKSRTIQIRIHSRDLGLYIYLIKDRDLFSPPTQMKKYLNAPSSWRNIHPNIHSSYNWKFEFKLPNEFSNDPIIYGGDSYGEEYFSNEMKVKFDWGFNVSFGNQKFNDINYKSNSYIIGCQVADVETFSKEDTLNIAAVHFEHPYRFTFWIEYKDKNKYNEAMQIINTIEFIKN